MINKHFIFSQLLYTVPRRVVSFGNTTNTLLHIITYYFENKHVRKTKKKLRKLEY